MNIDELLLKINTVTFKDLICQAEIQSEEDKRSYEKMGYMVRYTASEFASLFDADPYCIWYGPAITSAAIYYNHETFAAANIGTKFFAPADQECIDSVKQIIATAESFASNSSYMLCLNSLPDGMKMEYLNRLLEDKGNSIPDLYHFFISNYVMADYGFAGINKKTLRKVLASKTQEEKEKTAKCLESLPEVLTIYRGGNTASTPACKAYSWTLDINTANFFACRRGTGEGYIAKATVKKDSVIEALLKGRGEQEILVDPKNVEIVRTIPVHGLDFVASYLDDITPMYHRYLNQMEKLEFAQDSEVHGFKHEARVLLLALTISHLLGLPLEDQRCLAAAAIFHDTQRTNDTTDPLHGKAGREYYNKITASTDPEVEFLCEYHCLPDEAGHQEIRKNPLLSKNKARSGMLLDVFKDADALDRVRFGIKDLDMNQLRLPISRELSLVARIYHQQLQPSIHPKFKYQPLEANVRSASERAAGSQKKPRQKKKAQEH